VGEIPLYFYVPVFPWKDFSMGWIRKIKKNKNERMEERKGRDFYNLEVPILVCSPSIGNALWLPPSCDPPSGEPTHMGTSPTT
jgi:hypothetical protein